MSARPISPQPRRGRRTLWGLFLVVGYAGFLAASAPASVGAWLVAKASAGHMLLSGTAGSLWDGAAREAVVRLGQRQEYPLGGMRWQVRWRNLWKGRLAIPVEIAGADDNARAIMALAFGGVRVTHLAAAFDGGPLMRLLPLLAPAGLKARVRVHSDALTFSRSGGPKGRADLILSGVTTSLGPVPKLGTYAVHIVFARAGARFRVATVQGPLALSGAGTWSKPLGVHFEGLARPQGPRAAALDFFASRMGRRQPNGSYRVLWPQGLVAALP
ncbi:MAG: type II secretion system protein N [Betaproteobacteria bacterium]|nr:type II secretion system protein N [Betaproteobacteria bacterium]